MMTAKEKRSFKTQTKKMLDIMVHSIYTHKEIFLRELISNSADALNKIRFKSLEDKSILADDEDLKIAIEIDEDLRTLTVEDNGIGMSKSEVIENIGTIAQSGSEEFLNALKEKEDALEIIGQFGVGFYSAFMVAQEVEIYSKRPNDKGVYWHSTGMEEYIVEDYDKKTRGTKIILHLREGEEFDEFLNENKIQSLVKKHSNYVPFPIKMDVESYEPVENSEDDDMKKVIKNKTLNSMTPLWKKNKNEIEKEDYHEFYKNQFHDFSDPFDVIHSKAEGMIAYNALLYIPSKASMNFMHDDFKPGIQLYSKQVFIMKHAENLLPDYLNFVRGIVDSPDFSLNISREMLQKDRQLNRIGKNLERKILRTLENNLKENRDAYENWWNDFGIALKNGIYQDPSKKDDLIDLLLFSSNKTDDGYTTLNEYVDHMKPDQEKIYYLVTRDKQKAMNLPQLEKIEEKDYEVLFLTDPVDEFMINFINNYADFELSSLNKASFDDDEGIEALKEENKDLLETIQENLKNKIDEVKISNKLRNTAVCLVTDNQGMSLQTEELLKKIQDLPANSKKILEINPTHEIFKILKNEFEKNKDSEVIKDYSEILYNQALLMEGLEIENPTAFANKISELMIKSKK